VTSNVRQHVLRDPNRSATAAAAECTWFAAIESEALHPQTLCIGRSPMFDHRYERLRDTMKLADVLSEDFDDRLEGTNGRSNLISEISLARRMLEHGEPEASEFQSRCALCRVLCVPQQRPKRDRPSFRPACVAKRLRRRAPVATTASPYGRPLWTRRSAPALTGRRHD
jgi:hypothetical protein